MASPAVEPEEILRDLLARDGDLRLERYYGERAVFYNPGGGAPLGVIFASLKEGDGPNDRRARLSRPGVYRLAFGLPPSRFAALFGSVPTRPPKGAAVALPGHDLARLNELSPHPVYAWMGWVQILAPTAERYAGLRPLVDDSLARARARYVALRSARQGSG